MKEISEKDKLYRTIRIAIIILLSVFIGLPFLLGFIMAVFGH